MTETLATTDQEELDTIINGLISQAKELEVKAADAKANALIYGALALVAAIPAVGLNYSPEVWPHEKDLATGSFVVLALSTSVQILRHRMQTANAKRKQELVDRLQEEADLLELAAIY